MQHNIQKIRGVSLIEVLVAMLVIALGILVMVVMQINASRLTKASEVRSLGALLTADLADRMRANPAGTVAGHYALSTKYPANGVVSEPMANTACQSTTATCTPQQMAQQDLADWQRSVFFALPGGSARISAIQIDNTTGENGADVWLIWREPDAGNTATTTTECPSDAVATGSDGKPSALQVQCMYFRINL